MRLAALFAADDAVESAFAGVLVPLDAPVLLEEPDAPFCVSSCFESASSRSIICVRRRVVAVFVPPSEVPERDESSDRSLEFELEPSSDVRRAESELLPKSDESVLRPVVEERPRSDEAERPVPSRLEVADELPDEPELPAVLPEEPDELPDVETLPTESDGIEGMDGPEISGMLRLGMLWAASIAGLNARSRAMKRTLSERSVLQHGKLFFNHFEA